MDVLANSTDAFRRWLSDEVGVYQRLSHIKKKYDAALEPTVTQLLEELTEHLVDAYQIDRDFILADQARHADPQHQEAQ